MTSAFVGILTSGVSDLGIARKLRNEPRWTVICCDFSLDHLDIHNRPSGISPGEITKNSEFLVLVASDPEKADKILFRGGIFQDLPPNATLLVSLEAPTSYYDELASRVSQIGRSDISIVDFHVLEGGQKAGDEKVTCLASGSSDAISRCEKLLHVISDELSLVTGGLGSANKMKLVSNLIMGTHVVASAEATGLAEMAGLDSREVYNIVRDAAGGSTAYASRVPRMLARDWAPQSTLDSLAQSLELSISTARDLHFPLPLGSAAEQVCLSGISRGYGSDDDAGLVRLFAPTQAKTAESSINTSDPHRTVGTQSPVVSNIGFVGLGAMGQGMAQSLVRGGFAVKGYDIYPPSIDSFTSSGVGASAASCPSEAARGAHILILVVQNSAQVSDVLFEKGKAAQALPDNAIVVLSSTVPPSFSRDVEKRLRELGRGIQLIDAPVSGGVARAARGELTIICSGSESSLHTAQSALLSMSGVENNICRVKGGVGAASSTKLVNQLLAGVHIAASAEALAFAARLGLNTRDVYKCFKQCVTWSWMFENRAPQMLEQDWTPHSALAIFVKDLRIVLNEAKRLRSSTPMSSAAHTLYISGAAQGWSKESDAGIVRLWEPAGVSVSESARRTGETT